MQTRFEITFKTILQTLGLLVGFWLVIQLQDILFLLFISFILMCALGPIVDVMERIKFPRIVSIALIYIVIFGLFGVSFAGALPSLVSQSVRFIQDLPMFASRVLPTLNIDANAISQQIAPVGENIVRVTVGLFSNVITTLTVLVFAFYFLLSRHKLQSVLDTLVGVSLSLRVTTIISHVEKRLGAWVLGEFFLMLCIGVFVYIGLYFLHVDFALPLAIIAGILEIVPIIGPILSAVPAVLVAFSVSPFLALLVVVLFIVVQQLENNLIVPLVMKKSVGLAPLVTMLALMIGARFAGVIGAMLSVPILLVVQVIISDLMGKSKNVT